MCVTNFFSHTCTECGLSEVRFYGKHPEFRIERRENRLSREALNRKRKPGGAEYVRVSLQPCWTPHSFGTPEFIKTYLQHKFCPVHALHYPSGEKEGESELVV